MSATGNLKIICCYILFSFFGIVACKKEDELPAAKEESIYDQNYINYLIPSGFPQMNIPDDNKPTVSRIELGKLLFFDPILSRDSTISCGSCHKESIAFTDGLNVSKGIEGRRTDRNSMSLVNVGYQPVMFWDGGNPTLEQQVIAPIDNHNELDFDVNLVVERLKKQQKYVSLFKKAYNQEPGVYALTRAIACFERSLIGGTSRYDDYLKKQTVFTESETRGLNLFFSEEGECFHCHTGILFTDFSYQNNGLYTSYPDSGRARITGDPFDVALFKVPSLRNIEKTAPYMHDGSINTLEEVIEHYNSGGKRHRNKSLIIQPLKLSAEQKQDLVNFLKTLTDK